MGGPLFLSEGQHPRLHARGDRLSRGGGSAQEEGRRRARREPRLDRHHCGFKEKQGLNFPLLSDPDVRSVHKLYGAFGDKMMYGKKIVGALRTTALIRPDGTLARMFSNVKVDGHVDAVLAAIDEAIAAET